MTEQQTQTIIDFHTHIFPEKIAAKTLDFLSKRCQTKPFTNGTAEGLRASAKEALVSLSVAQPVVTNPSQFESINRYAKEISGDGILSFGGISPVSEDYKSQLTQLKAMGFKGIKLHPAYQGVNFNDIRYKRILSYASELDLIVTVHAGYDPGYPGENFCTTKMALELIDEVRPTKLILAHLGGYMYWDDVERDLAGSNVWLDTAVVFGVISDEQFIRLSRKHGTDRILFATDSPWSGQKESVAHLQQLDMTEEEKVQIFGENARKLLTL